MYTTVRMRRFATYCLTLFAIMLVTASSTQCATNWKLVLKNGRVIECAGAPIIANDIYMLRLADGRNATLAADQVDREKTDQVNKVDRQQWRETGGETPEVAVSPSSGILTLRDADFDAQVLKSKTPVMVEFFATWCGYCTRFEPTVQAIAGEYAGRLRVGKIDIDRNRATAQRYGIDGTPTVLLFKQGQIVGTIDGFVPKAEVVRMLRSGL
jgi:thioredoxin 1